MRDIGAVAAKILADPKSHTGKKYELTSSKKLTFSEMAQMITNLTESHIEYTSPNLIRFFLVKRLLGLSTELILVLIVLHYFPRFQPEPSITDYVKLITNKSPFSFEDFVKDNLAKLKKNG